MLAVDFNHWKTVSSWSALAGAIDAVILKATQYTTYVDPAFAGSLATARKTGKCVGVYHFVGRNGMQTAHLPPGDPTAEADWFLSKYAHQPGEMVIVDYEPDAEPADPDAWLSAHCARIIARTGVVPVVYMNFSTAAKRSWAKTRALGCALWIARYYANNGRISGADPDAGPWGSFIGWQYTSNGSLPGISAQVDLSRFDLTPAQWRAFGSAPPTPIPAPVEDDMTPEDRALLTETHLFAQQARDAATGGNNRAGDILTAINTAVIPALGKSQDPVAIAQALVQSLPADIAKQVVAEMGKQLTPTSAA